MKGPCPPSAGYTPRPADQAGCSLFDAVDRGKNDLGVLDVQLAVVVEVVHPAVAIVVDEDVGRVAVHVSAERRAAARITAADVVLRRTESAHDVHAARRIAVLLEVLQHQLELVDEPQIEHEVLRPDVLLIVREEVAEREVVRQRACPGSPA